MNFTNSPRLHRNMKDVDWAFTSLKRLGASGSVVDLVRNNMSEITYARKKLRRGEDIKSRNIRLREFRTELAALHKVRHEHLVTCVGSYTDENVYALILSPAADYDLGAMLFRNDPLVTEQDLMRLPQHFGCMATGSDIFLERQFLC